MRVLFRAVDKHSGVPMYVQIMNAVKKEIILGNLHEGERLPPVRELKDVFAVNVNTVIKALEKLCESGILEAKHGIGHFVKKGRMIDPEAVEILKKSVKELKESGVDLNTATLIFEEVWRNAE